METIYVCTDSGREGEYIYRLVAQEAGVKNKKEKRVWIDSQTEEEILRGIREAKDLSEYNNLSDAAYLRAKEDYLMGINFSRLLTLKYGNSIQNYLKDGWKSINVGRVMTCVLGMICNREREIRSFVKTPFYRVLAATDIGGRKIDTEWKAVEMHFHTRYKAYSEAVIGGRWEDIKNTKDRMFRQLSAELMNLVRIQFIISTAVYLLCVVVLPQYGFSGRVMQIYPCLAAGYFILFILYAEIIFLYYFNDLTGALLATLGFCLVTWAGSVLSAGGSDLWYGMGLVAGSFTGFTIAYFRLRFMERHMDEHIFCGGQLFTVKRERMPESMVYTKKQKER